MKNSFIRNSSVFRPVDPDSLVVIDTLPVGTYNLGRDQSGFFLTLIENFVLPAKTYGDTERQASRIFTTFMGRPAGTGVMLAGEKGSGKTMLAKKLSTIAAAHGVITIVINEAHFGDAFNRFIQGIEQPAVVLFDEFEKTYSSEEQPHMLTLLDGTFSSKKMFVLTCNDKWRIDAHMRNRPGRIFYSIDFRGLQENFIREYLDDHLQNTSHANGVLRIAGMFSEFNFDMLKALVEEMNRYSEPAHIAAELLNIQPEGDSDLEFRISLHVNGTEIPLAYPDDAPTFHGHPMGMNDDYCCYFKPHGSHAELCSTLFNLDDDGDFNISTGPHLFEQADHRTGTFVFEVRECSKARMHFIRVPKTPRRSLIGMNWDA